MSRVIGLLGTALFLLVVGKAGEGKFSKYRAVETYEIRPGILMMPNYSGDGQVCEIEIERRHSSPDGINFNSGLSSTEINEIANELAPANERGIKPAKLLEQGTTNVTGNTMVTNEEYENISIRIYRTTFPSSDGRKTVIGEAFAKIIWKNRKCQINPLQQQ